MISQTKPSKSHLQHQIDDLLEKSSENIEKAKSVQGHLQKTTEEHVLSKREIVITESDPLNFALGTVTGFIATYAILTAIEYAKNLWDSRNVNPLSKGEKISNNKETNPLLHGKETAKNIPLIQEMPIPNAETSLPQEVKIAENTPTQKPDISALVTNLENSNAKSGLFLNKIPKEIPKRDKIFAEIKQILMDARADMKLDGSGKKDKLKLKDYFKCLERTNRDPKKAKKEYGNTLYQGCLTTIEKLKAFLTDIDPNIDKNAAIEDILSNAWRGTNSKNCLESAAEQSIQFLKNKRVQSNNVFFNQTGLEFVSNSEYIGSNQENNPNPYSLDYPQDASLWNKVENGTPIPNINIKTVCGENYPIPDLPSEKLLQGVQDLGTAALRGCAAVNSRNNPAAAILHANECVKNAVSGVLNTSEFLKAGMEMMDAKGLNHLDLMDPLHPIYPAHTTDCNSDPGIIARIGGKIGAALQGYGDALNRVDVYGDPFNPYSDSNIPSHEDNSRNFDNFDHVNLGGPFDRGPCDPNSGWPEK